MNSPDTYYVEGRQMAGTSVYNNATVGLEEMAHTNFAKPRFNLCMHLKEQAINLPFLLLTKAWPEVYVGTQLYYLVKYYRKAGYANFKDLKNLVIPSWNDPKLDGMRRRAWWSMQPRFESEISMLNFIYELKDFRRAAELLLRFAQGRIYGDLLQLKSILTRMGRLQKAAKDAAKTSAAASKVWSDAWLQLQFNIKPLISDIIEIFKACNAVSEEVQAEFEQRGKDSQLTHYTEQLDHRYSGSWGNGNNRMYFTGSRSLSTFTATMEYRYEYDLRTGWDLTKRVWGLELNAEVIWNATMFTFLVDYFLQVGKAIRNMQLDPNVHTQMYQYCETLKSSLHYGVGINTADSLVVKFYCPTKNRGKDLKLGYQSLSGAEASWYDRRVDVAPNKGTALPRWKKPSRTQLFNLAALIRSMVG